MNNEFDSVLEQIDGWGRYQKGLWFLGQVCMDFVLCLNMKFMVFGGAAPNWSCVDQGLPPETNTSSTAAAADYDGNTTATVPAIAGNCSMFHECTQFKFDEDLNSIVTEFGLYCDRDYVADSLASLQFSGLLVGAIVYGQLSEIFGRKWTTLSAYIVGLLAGIAASFAPSWHVFGLFLFFMGVANGGFWCVVFVLVQEITKSAYREFTFVVCGWMAASFAFAWLQWWLRDWRALLLYPNLAGLLCILPYIYWVHESPRWLIQHRRVGEADAVVRSIARRNGVASGPDDLQLVALQLLSNKTSEAQLRDGGGKQTGHKKYSYWHLCRTPQLTARLIALVVSWFVTAHISFGLMINLKSLPGDRYLNKLVSAATDVTSAWLTLLASRWVGRRVLQRVSLCAMAVCLTIVAVTYLWLTDVLSSSVCDGLITWFAVLGHSAGSPAWLCIYMYSAELFPTVIRPLGNSSGSVAARLGGILGPLVLYTGQWWSALPYLVWVGLLLINLLLAAACLPETRGRALPDQMPPKGQWAKAVNCCSRP